MAIAAQTRKCKYTVQVSEVDANLTDFQTYLRWDGSAGTPEDTGSGGVFTPYYFLNELMGVL